MKNKYGIQDCDIYNFDETGFMMGQICGHMVVTGSERRGRSKKIQPGNREWATAICCISGDGYDVPPYLIVKGVHHLANCVLKRAYGQEINDFIRAHITNISKVEFFLAFAAAYKRSMTKENIAGGFRGAGLIPYNPETVISKLDVKLRTPSPKKPVFPNTGTWVSQTPHNPTEAVCQSTLVKSRISRHRSSSPTPIFEAVKHLAKGIEQIAHQNTLILAENRSLRKANEALSKRRRAKKTRIREGGSSTVQDVQNLLQLNNADNPVREEESENGEGTNARPAIKRRCGNCGNTGHNARTCQEDEEMSDIYSSDCIQEKCPGYYPVQGTVHPR
ncbi:hypothetical protein OOU_Y34scaffold01032g2 [Pyricularia oryzae Y34]|uniref:CCHC-type domain-containing protein n=1 Tax=Pyricularia oryzae (strain Y34) TaxID=1143189 RepID=A0AA97NMD3_PYRO3|nr:hypothetical protein OOU_Y34scaffold01032g2 [Pyricularia oryzae Y34]